MQLGSHSYRGLNPNLCEFRADLTNWCKLVLVLLLVTESFEFSNCSQQSGKKPDYLRKHCEQGEGTALELNSILICPLALLGNDRK